jgi:hypothetical protein
MCAYAYIHAALVFMGTELNGLGGWKQKREHYDSGGGGGKLIKYDSESKSWHWCWQWRVAQDELDDGEVDFVLRLGILGSNKKPTKTKQSKAKQSKAKQRSKKPNQTKQNKHKTNTKHTQNNTK